MGLGPDHEAQARSHRVIVNFRSSPWLLFLSRCRAGNARSRKGKSSRQRPSLSILGHWARTRKGAVTLDSKAHSLPHVGRVWM